MSVEVTGSGGAGEVLVYQLPDGYTAVLETLSFTTVTDASGNGHAVRIKFVSSTGEIVARLDDLNVAGDGQENFYTYGIGLNASACTLTAGLAVTDALPWTELLAGTQIFIQPIDNAGVIVAGDQVSAVLMHFDRGPASQAAPKPLPLTLLPGSVAA